VQVTVNGAVEQVEPGTTVQRLVHARVEARRHVAVALNGAVVPRSAWTATVLQQGDSVEVLVAVAGG
jgi:sulfur carrier protein